MQWIWTWANFGRWWGASVRPGVLQSVELWRVIHNWAAEQQQHLNTQTPKGSPVSVYPTPTVVLTFSHVTISLSVMFNFFILLLQYKCHRDNKSLSVCSPRHPTYQNMPDAQAVFLNRIIGIYKESWALKNSCFRTVVLEKTLESPLDCKGIQPVHSKGNQSWVFTGRTDVEAETPILWPRDANNWLIWKDPHAGQDCRQEKGMTEDEMAGWHHWLTGHESE